MVRSAVERAGLSAEQVDEVVMGNVVSAGLGQNPARQAALGGGLTPKVAALTINKVCGSGLKAVGLAAQAIQTGEAEIVVAGGMESMSNCPYLLPNAREGQRLGHGQILDSMIQDGLWDAYEKFLMGSTARSSLKNTAFRGNDRTTTPFKATGKPSRRWKPADSETRLWESKSRNGKEIRGCSTPMNLPGPMRPSRLSAH